jgi:hypothetical protein
MSGEFDSYQRQQDENHLNLLFIFFRIYAGLCGAGSLLTFLYIGIGLLMMSEPQFTSRHSQQPPFQFGGEVMIMFGCIAFIFCLAFGITALYAANWIRDRKNWVGIIIVSALCCLNGLLAIALGVFSIITLNKPSVKSLFSN